MKPRDAGSLVVVDASGGVPRILFGKRREDLKFAPGKYVFPGGSVDPADLSMACPDDLAADDVARLMFKMKGRPSLKRARALALAAIREAFEETGLLIGAPLAGPPARRGDCWDQFLDQGFAPRLSGLHFLARAITPPGRTRRFDARFFCVSASDVVRRTDRLDGEFVETAWLTIDDARYLDLHSMTRAILDDLADRLDERAAPRANHPVPFYYQLGSGFRREEIRLPDGR
ncbi:MAG: NUDIX domain-containing protein [Hyphomicrobiaceae bacterium]